MSMNGTNAQNGKYAEVNGLHMYYEEYGKGSPLVLIHGGASTVQTSFGRLIPELSKTHRIIGWNCRRMVTAITATAGRLALNRMRRMLWSCCVSCILKRRIFLVSVTEEQQHWRLRFITRSWSAGSYLLLPCINVPVALLHSGRGSETRDWKTCPKYIKKCFSL